MQEGTVYKEGRRGSGSGKGLKMKKDIMLSILIAGIMALIVVALGYFSGFLVPHTTDRSGEVNGRVLDAITHAPIQGAKVCLIESPHHTIYTDATGHFHMKATRNFHWGYVPPEGDWPGRKDKSIEISYPGYQPYGFIPDTIESTDVGDIFLKPDKK